MKCRPIPLPSRCSARTDSAAGPLPCTTSRSHTTRRVHRRWAATRRSPLPFGRLTNGLYSPTAVHLFAAAQLTPFKYPFVSDGGYGVETAVHCVPSQRNALRPTAMHAVIDVHETLRTWSMAGG